jgi:molybdenum cofactor cytidylyltransferase
MEHRFGAVILAAGKSSRMGRPKLLLPWGRGSVIEHLIRQWQEVGAQQVTVVLAERGGPVAGELDRIEFPGDHRIFNPNHEAGMFSSIQCAAEWGTWQERLGHVVVVLGDQPHLRPATLKRLVECASGRPEEVCQPARLGKAYHPVMLPWLQFCRLAAAKTPDLSAFLKTCRVTRCEIDDPGLDLDLDTPVDYEAALKLAL